MRFWLPAVLIALPATVLAEDGGNTAQPQLATTSSPVIGGTPAPAGKWPDTVAVLWNGYQGCTGTLIAPTVVLTAGHCVADGAPNGVLVGASALSRASEGERLQVRRAVEYTNSWTTVDAGVLILSTPSTITPRAIASGWAKFDIVNGAQVALVGFGTTDRDGEVSTDSLMEAMSTITDYNCTTSAGCNDAAQPDGELGAGGMGIDTCPGDSGGPAYLVTEYGSFVAGITSRGYDNNNYACSEGGIYGRADKIIDWIESTTGVSVTRGPAPSAEPIMVVRGDAGETQIVHNDPLGGEHTYTITTPPGYAQAAVRQDGRLRVCASSDVTGPDRVVVTVADAANATRSVEVRVPIEILDGEAPDDCDVNDFGGEGGGCCDAGRSAGGSIPLALFVVGMLLRRRRAR